MSLIDLKNLRVDPVSSFHKFHTTVDVLRLDLIHPIISGNKWFKLKEYLEEARKLNKKFIVTYGGAFSNHIIATAAAARESGMRSIGIIRGEKTDSVSITLKDAISFGMELAFISREDYRKKTMPSLISDNYNPEDIYIINEGGYGLKGTDGAADILKQIDSAGYSHIIAAVGTGTTLAGLIKSSQKEQQVTGISVLKNNLSLKKEIDDLLPAEYKEHFNLIHDYHFGGYAKYTAQLLNFMNTWFESTNIPSDFVYTGKLFYAINDLIQKNHFPSKSKLLIIHSGGLQGNRSLPKGALIF